MKAVRIVSVELGRREQAHDGSGALAGTQAPGEQPVPQSERDRPDAVRQPFMVDRHIGVAQEARQRHPAVEAAVDRSGSGRSVRTLLPLPSHPLEQRIGHWPAAPRRRWSEVSGPAGHRPRVGPGSSALHYAPDDSLRPTIPATMRPRLTKRPGFAGSPNSTMPRMAVPTAPTPTHTA